MSKSSRHSRIKKFFLCFSVVVSLVFVNFGLFAVQASANAVWGSDYTVYISGAPMGLDFSYNSDSTTTVYRGFIPSVNVYALSNNTNDDDYVWIGSLADNDYDNEQDIYSVRFKNSPSSGADIDFLFEAPAYMTFSLMSPLVFYDDIETRFNNLITLVNPSVTAGTVYLDYRFEFSSPSTPGGVDYITYTDAISVNSSGTATFRFFPLAVFDHLYSYSVDSYLTDSDEELFVLLDASVSVRSYCENFYINATTSRAIWFNDYQSLINNRFSSILDFQTVQDNVSFDSLDWTDWLVNAVGGFMDLELVPGLSFAGMLGLVVGMSLFIVFLKIFAGG